MATLVLSAAGAAVGSWWGGAVLGVSSAAIGQAVGATLGRVIDARLLGEGSAPVETGRIDRYRFTGAGEGAGIPWHVGRMRVGGHVIWATRFREHVTIEGGGGKGGGAPTRRRYSYSVSLAIALGEGPVLGVERVWADGRRIAAGDLDMRFYPGDEEQLPDPKIAAVEGAENVPAYRGIAYVVIEDLDLAPFGNRVPQFSFEVIRPAAAVEDAARGIERHPREDIAAVCLIPGTGEYALATTPVHFAPPGAPARSSNVNTPEMRPDLAVSLDALAVELPRAKRISLVVSWFGDDLRVNACRVRPKVEHRAPDGTPMPWRAGGIDRAAAAEVSRDAEGRPVYGGTPADGAVREAIAEIARRGGEVMFYPFLLMDIQPGNGLPDPWSGAADQPVMPWRGRITASVAPGRPGSPDGTAAAEAEVAAFFGTARPEDFGEVGGEIVYTGPDEWSWRRFILHYAHLCRAAGGVAAFCIGSELRGITTLRGADNGFPAVAELRRLAADVRAVLGPDVKIGYAADWSEYFGYHPEDGSGDVFFHLDPLWADDNIDFIGIDNYMPLSDWRDGQDHLDAGWGDIHNLDYLTANVAGGEGFDWYYADEAARRAQRRTPIRDTAHGEDWIFRPKDIRGWWENSHHERIGGVRQAQPTGWEPRSKPVWFTEMGCAAIDKGTNQPNVFLDPKSSESRLPHFSNGMRDDLIQLRYLAALYRYWRDPANNPVSPRYGGPMVEMDRAHVWAWDARPWPEFPERGDLWADGGNYERGHWLNGRVTSESFGRVAAEVLARAGGGRPDVRAAPYLVRGARMEAGRGGRAWLQPLLLAGGIDAIEGGGGLVFRRRGGPVRRVLGPSDIAEGPDGAPRLVRRRAAEAETAGRLRIAYLRARGDFETGVAEAVFPDERGNAATRSELPLALLESEAAALARRWLAEARLARERLEFALAPFGAPLAPGDVIRLDPALLGEGEGVLWRVDRVEMAERRQVTAVRTEPGLYLPAAGEEGPSGTLPAFVPPLPVEALFMDLPLIRGDEVPHAPHLALSADPWPGEVALYAAPGDAGYALEALYGLRATVGVLETPLAAADPALWDLGAGVTVRLVSGALASADPAAVLAGANTAVIGVGEAEGWEVVRFAEATLVGPGRYRLRRLLRGQAGSDADMAPLWPAGSRFVLLDGVPRQIDLPLALRNVVRHYRVGPAGRPYDDPSYRHHALAFRGIGLRPLAPVHLRAEAVPGGVRIGWIRRTRIGGDDWEAPDVPLGEARERYRVRVLQGGVSVREVEVSTSEWLYDDAARAADGVSGPFDVEVGQLSDRFGLGAMARMTVHG